MFDKKRLLLMIYYHSIKFCQVLLRTWDEVGTFLRENINGV